MSATETRKPVFENYKGGVDKVEASSTNTWLATVTPDQRARVQTEEATFICSEHAHRVHHHFDNDDFKAVLLANDTELVTATNTVMDDDDAQIDPDMPVTGDDEDDDDNAWARTLKVKEPDCDKLRPLFRWMNTKTINEKTFEKTTQCT
jgi:hypothetical protein